MKKSGEIDFNNSSQEDIDLFLNQMQKFKDIMSDIEETNKGKIIDMSLNPSWHNKTSEEKIEYMKNHPIEKNICVGDSQRFIFVETLKEYVNNDQFSYIVAKSDESDELIGLVCDWSNGERNILGEYFDYHQRILDFYIKTYKESYEREEDLAISLEESEEVFECGNCGKEVSSEAKTCPYCKYEFEESEEVFECGNCGKEVSSEAKKCPYCKYEFEE